MGWLLVLIVQDWFMYFSDRVQYSSTYFITTVEGTCSVSPTRISTSKYSMYVYTYGALLPIQEVYVLRMDKRIHLITK